RPAAPELAAHAGGDAGRAVRDLGAEAFLKTDASAKLQPAGNRRRDLFIAGTDAGRDPRRAGVHARGCGRSDVSRSDGSRLRRHAEPHANAVAIQDAPEPVDRFRHGRHLLAWRVRISPRQLERGYDLGVSLVPLFAVRTAGGA